MKKTTTAHSASKNDNILPVVAPQSMADQARTTTRSSAAFTDVSANIQTVASMAERYPHILTEAKIRSEIHASVPRPGANGTIKANGLAVALIRRNRRVYILEDHYFKWFAGLAN